MSIFYDKSKENRDKIVEKIAPITIFGYDNFKENRDKIVETISSNLQTLSSVLISNKDTFYEIYDGLTLDIPKWYGKEKLEGATKMINDVCNTMLRDFTEMIGNIVSYTSDQVDVSQSLSLQELQKKLGFRLPSDFSYENVHTQNLLVESGVYKKQFRQLLIIQNTHEQIIKEIERIKDERPNFFALILIVNSLLPENILENPERQVQSNEEIVNENFWVDRYHKMEIPTVNTFVDVIDSVRLWVYDVEQMEDKDNVDMIKEGNKLAGLKKYDEALSIYDKTLEFDSRVEEAWYRKGFIYFEQGKYQEALECYNRALEINPAYYDAFYGKGLVMYELKKYQEALEAFDRALSIDENNHNSLYNKGLALSKLERQDEALKAFETVTKINPGNYEPWYQKGLIYSKLGRNEDALECYYKVIELKPRYTEALYNIGIVLNTLGRYEDAVKYFDEAIKTSPKFAEAFYGRAISHFSKNSMRNALADLKKAIEIGKMDDKDFFRKQAIQDENFASIRDEKRFRELTNTGYVIFDSARDTKLHDSKTRTITKEGSITPGGLGVECRASGSPKINVNSDGTFSLVCGDGHGRIYVYALNYNSVLETEFAIMSSSVDDFSLNLRSRHSESGDCSNRFGGFESAVSLGDINFKTESCHPEHENIINKSLSKKLELNKFYKSKYTCKNSVDNKQVEFVHEIDYMDGKGYVTVLTGKHLSPRPFYMDKESFEKQSYFWLRLDGSGEIKFKSVNLIAL